MKSSGRVESVGERWGGSSNCCSRTCTSPRTKTTKAVDGRRRARLLPLAGSLLLFFSVFGFVALAVSSGYRCLSRCCFHATGAHHVLPPSLSSYASASVSCVRVGDFNQKRSLVFFTDAERHRRLSLAHLSLNHSLLVYVRTLFPSTTPSPTCRGVAVATVVRQVLFPFCEYLSLRHTRMLLPLSLFISGVFPAVLSSAVFPFVFIQPPPRCPTEHGCACCHQRGHAMTVGWRRSERRRTRGPLLHASILSLSLHGARLRLLCFLRPLCSPSHTHTHAHAIAIPPLPHHL